MRHDMASHAPEGSSAEANIDRQNLLLEFFASWGRSYDELIASFDLLAPDCRWIQRPIPTLVGPDAARRFLAVARRTMGLATVDVDVLSMAENGHTVFVERVDHLRRADGSLIASAPVTGVLDFRNDHVVRWREYFDGLEFIGRAAQTGAVHGVKRALGAVTGIRR